MILVNGVVGSRPSDLEKFSKMVHYIVYRCKNNTNFGKMVLYKLCYFSDFNNYELYEKSITGETYYRLEMGPAPGDFDKIMSDLIRDNTIECIERSRHGKKQFHYVSDVKPDMSEFTEEELDVIENVIMRYGSKTASTISSISHKDVPWKIAKDHEPLDYEAVFYRNPATSVKPYE
jgi:uncharacterized phage-associated protein